MLVVALAITFASALVVGPRVRHGGPDSGLARWDRSVADWGSEHATARSTDVLSALTNLGGTAYLAIIAVVVAPSTSSAGGTGTCRCSSRPSWPASC